MNNPRHSRARRRLLLTTDCQHCRKRIVEITTVGWMHAGGQHYRHDHELSQLSLLCAGGRTVATPARTEQVVHIDWTCGSDSTFDLLLAAAMPPDLAAQLRQAREQDRTALRGLIIALMISLPLWIGSIVALVLLL